MSTVTDKTVHDFYRTLLNDDRYPDSYAALRDALIDVANDVRRAVADEIEDALGDTELLPAGVRAAFDDLLHRLRTGRER